MSDEYKKLANMKLEPPTREHIWRTIEQRIDAASADTLANESTSPSGVGPSRRWRAWSGPIAAAVAAIVVLAIGIPVVMHQLRPGTPSTGSSHHVKPAANNVGKPAKTASPNQPITVAGIRTYYATQKQRVVHVTQVAKYHAVIVESNVDPTVANDFAWWDLRTGQHYRLAGRPLYMKLDHVVSADKVVLFATGADNIGPDLSFPFYVVAKRPNTMSPFTTQTQTAYLPVSQPVSLTDHKQEMLTNVVTSTDGVEMAFGPNPGEPAGAFAADNYGVPQTNISYVADKNDIVIRFKNTNAQISPTALQSVHNAFVSISSLQTQGTDTVLTLHLAAQAKYYTGKVVHTNTPSLTLTFAAQQP